MELIRKYAPKGSTADFEKNLCFLICVIQTSVENAIIFYRGNKMDEYWDGYNSNREITDVTLIRGEEIPEGVYHLVVHLEIFNSKGQLLSQQRASEKTFGDMWDVTVGGSALKGETSQQAMHRELLEELGLDRDFSSLVPTFTIKGKDFFDDHYFLFEDTNLDDIVLQAEEVEDKKWLTKEETFDMVEKGEFIPYTYVPFLFDLLKIIVDSDYDGFDTAFIEDLKYVEHEG